jgi:hypothetical protein
LVEFGFGQAGISHKAVQVLDGLGHDLFEARIGGAIEFGQNSGGHVFMGADDHGKLGRMSVTEGYTAGW